MKQKTFFTYLIGTMTLIGIIGISLGGGKIIGFTDTRADFTRDCDFYFDEDNAYTSLHEINQDLYGGTTQSSYKTWGTVTKISPDLNSNFNFYIQSTDKNGEVASMYVYQSSRTDINVGNVLTLVGAAELYNNLPEFINPLIEVDSLTNDSPVQTLVTDATFWENGSYPSSDQFLAAQLMGPRQVRINNVYLSHINTGNATILIDGSVEVPVYYANLSATSSIASRINAISGSTIDIIGYVNAYKSGTTTKLQLLLRDVKDLIGGVEFEYSLQMNSSTSYRVGSYSTGNYGQGTVGGFSFEHYRVTRPTGLFLTLLPNLSGVNDTTTAGAFYNTMAIYDINKIEVTYYTQSNSGEKPTLNYGPTRDAMTVVELPLSTTSVTQTIVIDQANYFSIETTELKLNIQSINLFYSEIDDGSVFDFRPANENNFRINPVVYQGTPVHGSSVEVPTQVVAVGDSYQVVATKTYTHYTFDYIENNAHLAAAAAYTDPADIAAYYTAFKTWPANYVVRGDYDDSYRIFGDKARCVSTYSRTDGYALSVPYQSGSEGTPLYHELDVALDSTYSDNRRGVGRVVVWEYGFDASRGAIGYDSAPVAVYTDDHYATFQEYLNTGVYGTRFNSEMQRTIYIWGAAETLN